jgi:hypothetical protein
MPIPVTFPQIPLVITDLENSQAENFLATLCQLLDAGTSGASITTPPLTAPNPSNPSQINPILLLTPEQQLFYRHLGIALAVAGIGGGGTTFERLTAANVGLGYGVYYSSNDTVSPGNSSDITMCGIIGVAQMPASSGAEATLISAGVVLGALSGATAGTPYYMGHDGSPILDGALVSGDRIIRLGYAKNVTDLEVSIQDIGLEP